METTTRPNDLEIKLDAGPSVGILTRIYVELLLAGHLVVVAFYWWLTPKGFPFDHGRFWLYSVLPVIAAIVASLGLVGCLYKNYRLAAMALICCAASWIAISISARLLFPISFEGIWLAGLIPAGIALYGWFLLQRQVHLPARMWLPASFVFAVLGWFAIFVQAPREPTTMPFAKLSRVRLEDAPDENLPPIVHLGDDYQFVPAQEELTLKVRGLTIRCRPLLTFDRISPDGFWSILAPRTTTDRRVQRQRSDSGSLVFDYSDGSTIALSDPTPEGLLELTATSIVERDTFTHLNSFCVLEINGHRKLALTFSPCPETPIRVMPADYPVGRPARFAYLDENREFSIVEATSGEKGPFHRLASGPLLRKESLSIGIYDDGTLIASVVLEDWASQVSTDLSPTAGWGVPVNAIEFQRHGLAEDSPTSIWITLAGTSVGRGWDTVGHRTGTYRNRMLFRIESGR